MCVRVCMCLRGRVYVCVWVGSNSYARHLWNINQNTANENQRQGIPRFLRQTSWLISDLPMYPYLNLAYYYLTSNIVLSIAFSGFRLCYMTAVIINLRILLNLNPFAKKLGTLVFTFLGFEVQKVPNIPNQRKKSCTRCYYLF